MADGDRQNAVDSEFVHHAPAHLTESRLQALTGTVVQMEERIVRERAFWGDTLPAMGSNACT